jgi:hypothetical protein
MSQHIRGAAPRDGLNDLVTALLGCGGVLSQIISQMVRWEASGQSAPDAAPIPETAHSLICSVLPEVKRKHSSRDLKVAARIINEVTEAISENIFLVPLDEAAASTVDGDAGQPGGNDM